MRPCTACAHSYMGPADDELVCGHSDAGSWGIYARHAVEDLGHCGPTRPKFEQHPLRNWDGSLKMVSERMGPDFEPEAQ